MKINDWNQNQKPENFPNLNLFSKDSFLDSKSNTSNFTKRILDFAEIESLFKQKHPEEYKKFKEFLKEYENTKWMQSSPWFHISNIDKLMLIISKKIEKWENIEEVYKTMLMYWRNFPRNWQKDDFEVKWNKDILKQRYFYNTIYSFRDPRVKNSLYYDYLEINSFWYWKIEIKNKETWEKNEIYTYSWYSNKMISEEDSQNYKWTPDFFSVTIYEVLMNIFEKQENLKSFYKIQNIAFCSWYIHILWEKWVLESYDLTNMQLVNRKFFDRTHSNLELISVDNTNIAIKSNGKIIIYKNLFNNKRFEKKEALYEFIYEIEKTIHFSKEIDFSEKERFLNIWDNIISLVKICQEKDIDIRTISYIFHSLVNDYKYRLEIIQRWNKDKILDKMLEKLEKDIETYKQKLEKIKANSN